MDPPHDLYSAASDLSDVDLIGTVSAPNVWSLLDRLVTLDNYAASPTLCERLIWITEGRRDRLVSAVDFENWRRSGRTSIDRVWNAELSIIGVVDRADCHLTARSSTITELQQSILTCSLAAPSVGLLRVEFLQAMRNVESLLRKLGSDAVPHSNSALVSEQGSLKLLLRHVPFVVSGPQFVPPSDPINE